MALLFREGSPVYVYHTVQGTDLELKWIAAGPAAEVAVPDGSIVDVLLSEGSRWSEASVVG